MSSDRPIILYDSEGCEKKAKRGTETRGLAGRLIETLGEWQGNG